MGFFDALTGKVIDPVLLDAPVKVERPVRVITLGIIQRANLRGGMQPEEIDARIEAVFTLMGE